VHFRIVVHRHENQLIAPDSGVMIRVFDGIIDGVFLFIVALNSIMAAA
tara:strand:- start:550 stop:693 length:144 start_codon:yes stop_codon:yes gene_type:complete